MLKNFFFLNILKKFKHVIENKKSDSATLKDKDEAWREIHEEHNSSSVISTQRTVKQLKKWWSNLKSDQRDALTKERQARMATGGGSPIPTVDVDPEIENIVPNLMTSAPTLFSSNIPRDKIERRRNAVLDDVCLEEFLIEQSDDINKTKDDINKNIH
ncbi:uncharacterized protein [Chelonus insularis]|uniref:uncharacterized protein n=1 Tax=Chelonus insularis TaxID=460826 RepID=UPI00158E8ED0|nr:uncharacterized protein LOC118070382 [Chelonus insularis]